MLRPNDIEIIRRIYRIRRLLVSQEADAESTFSICGFADHDEVVKIAAEELS